MRFGGLLMEIPIYEYVIIHELMKSKESLPNFAKNSEMKKTCSTFDIIISSMLTMRLIKSTDLATTRKSLGSVDCQELLFKYTLSIEENKFCISKVHKFSLQYKNSN